MENFWLKMEELIMTKNTTTKRLNQRELLHLTLDTLWSLFVLCAIDGHSLFGDKTIDPFSPVFVEHAEHKLS